MDRFAYRLSAFHPAVTALVVGLISVLVWYFPNSAGVVLSILIPAVVLLLVMWVPKYIYWLRAENLVQGKEQALINAITPDVELAKMQETVISRQIEYAKLVAMMDPPRLKALLALPHMAGVDESPWTGSFLVVPPGELVGVHSRRIPMMWVEEFADLWRQRIADGTDSRSLPPIGLWSDSRKRDSMRVLVLGLADVDLLEKTDGNQIWRSNHTAQVNPLVTASDCFKWMRQPYGYDEVE
jgi:hypothetical protein